MDFSDPLPLIERPDTIPTYEIEPESQYRWSLKTYGYLLIATTWILFIVSINSFFRIWSFIIYPWSLNPSTQELHAYLTVVFEQIDNLIVSGWCIYVMLWWWSLVSWCSLKLFRHSKGLQA
ncbi:hypothetical protein CLIB1423_16S00672 [[Candida] railenensis]|uniref:Uncharacterized protein n=1 Tax=[Candida] railenensis TaxID=45579 RepID=A0A9P0QRV5_9ASCO|nr:hypothetical protein CLIB1423_16S00672 [[Candida] railenensis]